MNKITIAVIEGSTREKRESIKAAKFVAGLAEKMSDVRVIFVDPKDFSFPNDGNDTEGKDARYTKIVAQADGFFIVTPEYNHSYPGSLKRMLDSEYDHYFHKPVALAGVSNGAWGGVRCVEALLPVMRSLGLLSLIYATYFARVQDIFDADGNINRDQEQKYTSSVQAQLDLLVWYARTLKAGRSTLPQ